ncbi:hypothetical protein L1887_35872 [Cichorium endivia]|nr:hypothetical protein L1887_35872 [Cichorium endivia]
MNNFHRKSKIEGEDEYVVLVFGLNVSSSSFNPLQLQLLVDHIRGHLGDEKNLASKDQSKLSEPIKELDIFLTQPLRRCLFPGSSACNTFRSCTNPHLFDVDNVRFLGTSGQKIDDLEKYSEAKENLEFMERTLRWRHLSPAHSDVTPSLTGILSSY